MIRAMNDPTPAPPPSASWLRALWALGGLVSLVTGIVGIVVPLLPTTPFVLLAAWCFARSSPRLEAWLLAHPRFGPMVRNWRERRAIPLRAKQLAWAMMALAAGWSWWVIQSGWRWAPVLFCSAVAIWMYRLPSR